MTATSMLVVTNMNKVGRAPPLPTATAAAHARPPLPPPRAQVVVVSISIVFMGEAKSWQAILGLAIALSGGAWYGAVQRGIASRRQSAEAAAAASVAEAGGGTAVRPK